MLTAAAITLLVLVHLSVGRSRFFEGESYSWRSVAGGVGISYAFLVLLPKIAASQDALQAAAPETIGGFLQHHAYLVALVGLVLHYGLDVAVEKVLVTPARRSWQPAVLSLIVFHGAGLAGYFLLMGYLVAKTSAGTTSLVLFTLAMAIHALAIGYGMLHKYGGFFDRWLSWIFAAATALGGLIAVTTEISHGYLALWSSLFAGMLIISTIKEKVPGSSDARFLPFLLGVLAYSSLLLLTEFVSF